MKFLQQNPPRSFLVGNAKKFELFDHGSVYLEDNEQITFKAVTGSELDIVRKDWGYYVTPSLNARLRNNGLRAVLVQNELTNRFFCSRC